MQVAEWAGHSVAVLLSTYAKCIDGQESIALERIQNALSKDDEWTKSQLGMPRPAHEWPTGSRKYPDLAGLTRTQIQAQTGA